MIEDFLKDYGIEIGNTKSEPTRDNSSRLSDINTNYEHDALFSGVGSKIGEQLGRYSYDLTHLQPEKNKYGKYDVYVNPVNSEEELKKERAKNQSAGEQLWRMGVQMAGSEVVLGTLRGFSDLADFMINIAKEEGEDDYTNAVSKQLEEWQNQMRERFEIYQEDPNKTFALGDFGWWTGNAVSAASTLMLLLPSKLATVGLAKGASWLGNLTKINAARSTAMGLYKAGNAAKAMNLIKNNPIKPATLAKQIKGGASLVTTATLSRTMENYIEARDVYNTVYEDTKQRLSEMTIGERQQFLSNNPQFEGKSDEEIAKYISSTSADRTFQNDYAMLLMDMMQLRSLHKLYKGVKSGINTTSKRIAEENFRRTINGVPTDELVKTGLLNKAKYFINNAVKNPMITTKELVFGLGLGEGVEEGFQYAQIEKGKEKGESYFNPALQERTLYDYLQDPHMWEQAFWGVAGGLLFRGGANYLYAPTRDFIKKKEAERLKAQGKISDTDYHNRLMTVEKQSLAEIEGRIQTIKAFKTNLGIINDGYSPYEYERNDKGEIIVENGSKVRKKLTEAEKIKAKEDIKNKFITDLVMNAADAGNYESLIESLRDSDFDKYLRDMGIDIDTNEGLFKEQIISQMEDVFELYNKHLDFAMGYIDSDDISQNKLIARDMTRKNLSIKSLDKQIAEYNRLINDSPNANTLTEDYANVRYYSGINANIAELQKHEQNITNLYNNKQISKAAYDEYMKDIRKAKETIRKFANNHLIGFNSENVNEFENDLTKYWGEIKDKSIVPPTDDIVDNLDKRINYEFARESVISEIPKSQEEYDEFVRNKELELNEFVRNKFLANNDTIINWLESQEDIDQAWDNLMAENVPDNIKKALDVIKFGYMNKGSYAQAMIELNKAVNSIKEDRAEKAKKESKTIINGEEVEDKDDEESEDSKEEESTATSPSTGKVTGSTTTTAVAPKPTTSTEDDAIKKGGMTQVDESGNVDSTVVPEGAPAIEVIPDELKTKDNILTAEIYSLNNGVFKIIYDISSNEGVDTILSIKEINSSEAKSLINRIFNQIKTLDVYKRLNPDNEIVEKSIINALQQYLNIANIKYKNTEKGAEIKDIINQLGVGIKINISEESGERKASIESLTKDESFNLIETLFNKFIIEAPLNPRGKVDGKTPINIESFINYLVKNNDIGYNELINVLLNIKNYVSKYRKTSNKYEFNNYSKLLDSFEKNPIDFIDSINIEQKQVINALHINATTLGNSTDVAEAINLVLTGKAKPYFTFNVGNKGFALTDSISISVNVGDKAVEIGFLSNTHKDSRNNSIRLRKQNWGIKWVISNSDGTITTNFDKMFDKIIETCDPNNTQLRADFNNFLTALYNYINNGKTPASAIAAIDELYQLNTKYNLGLDSNSFAGYDITKDYATNNSIPLTGGVYSKYQNARQKAVVEIIDNIVNILYHDNTTGIDELRISINNFKQAVYENYLNTDKINDKLMDGQNVPVPFNIRQVQHQKLNYTDDSRNINDSMYDWHIDLNDKSRQANIVVAYTHDGVVSEIGQKWENITDRHVGQMGLLVDENGGNPLVAMFTDRNSLDVKESKELREGIKSEIVDLIRKYYNDEITFEDLNNKLTQFLRQAGSKTPQLFTGIDIIKNKNGINIIDHNGKRTPDGNPIPIVTIYDDSFKDGKKHSRNIVYRDHAADNSYQSFAFADNTLEFIADEIVKRLSHNMSFFHIKSNPTNNDYFKINADHTFTIKIGTYNKTFKNYAEYIITNNAFKTNQVYRKSAVHNGNKHEVGFMVIEDEKDLYIDYEEINKVLENKVDYNTSSVISNTQIADEILSTGSKTKSVNTLSILSKFKDSEAIISAITTLQSENIHIIPEEFYVDARNTDDYGYYKDKKIYLTKKLIKYKNGAISRNEFIRVLMHEKFHNLLDEHNVFSKQLIVDELLETYDDFVTAINSEDLTDPNLTKEQKDLIAEMKRVFIEENNPWNYINRRNTTINKKNGNNNLKTDYKSIDELSDNDKRIFAEEWLVEAMTQEALFNYLNSKEVSSRNIINDKKNKTIWEKIVDALLKIFGKNLQILNKKSILAKQIKILNNAINTRQKATTKKTTAKERKNNKVKKGKNKSEQLSIDFDNSPVEGTVVENTTPVVKNTTEEIVKENLDKTNEDLNIDYGYMAEDDGDLPTLTEDDNDPYYSIIQGLGEVIEGETLEEVIINNYDVNTEVNIDGVTTMVNMTEFINRFDKEIQPKIAKMIENGQIKFVCK